MEAARSASPLHASAISMSTTLARGSDVVIASRKQSRAFCAVILGKQRQPPSPTHPHNSPPFFQATPQNQDVGWAISGGCCACASVNGRGTRDVQPLHAGQPSFIQRRNSATRSSGHASSHASNRRRAAPESLRRDLHPWLSFPSRPFTCEIWKLINDTF